MVGAADDGNQDDQNAAGQRDDVQTDVENLVGGTGDDDLTGGPAANALYGQAGNDKLAGGAGNDNLSGGHGSDIIEARDGVVDTVNCGADADSTSVDVTDRVATDCEAVERT